MENCKIFLISEHLWMLFLARKIIIAHIYHLFHSFFFSFNFGGSTQVWSWPMLRTFCVKTQIIFTHTQTHLKRSIFEAICIFYVHYNLIASILLYSTQFTKLNLKPPIWKTPLKYHFLCGVFLDLFWTCLVPLLCDSPKPRISCIAA